METFNIFFISRWKTTVITTRSPWAGLLYCHYLMLWDCAYVPSAYLQDIRELRDREHASSDLGPTLDEHCDTIWRKGYYLWTCLREVQCCEQFSPVAVLWGVFNARIVWLEDIEGKYMYWCSRTSVLPCWHFAYKTELPSLDAKLSTFW